MNGVFTLHCDSKFVSLLTVGLMCLTCLIIDWFSNDEKVEFKSRKGFVIFLFPSCLAEWSQDRYPLLTPKCVEYWISKDLRRKKTNQSMVNDLVEYWNCFAFFTLAGGSMNIEEFLEVSQVLRYSFEIFKDSTRTQYCL